MFDTDIVFSMLGEIRLIHSLSLKLYSVGNWIVEALKFSKSKSFRCEGLIKPKKACFINAPRIFNLFFSQIFRAQIID